MNEKNLKYLLSFFGGALASTGIASGAVALGLPSTVNVALNKPTFGDTAFGAPTSRGNDGIDGNTDSGNWTHADYPTSAVPYPGEVGNAPNAYWEVDLQGSYDLSGFEVVDRVGCCADSRLDGSTLTLLGGGGSILGTQALSGQSGGGGTEVFNTSFSGVERIRIDGNHQFFQFSEFRAFSTIASPINWALGAPAQYYDSGGTPVTAWNGLPASNITDGNIGSFSHPSSQLNAGHYVNIDLGQELLIDNLDLTGRFDGCCPDRLQDFTIEFVDGLGVVTHSMPVAGQVTTKTNIDVIGSFGGDGPVAQSIRIVNSNGDNYGPQIGEVEVYGIAAIPEPSGALLSLVGLGFLLRRRR